MGLKDDANALELFARCCSGIAGKELVENALSSLSSIEAALAVDDGPPREGDVVALIDCPVEGVNFLTQWYDHHKDRKAVLLMRSEEVARRIKEAGK